jgi:hypothetical protein
MGRSRAGGSQTIMTQTFLHYARATKRTTSPAETPARAAARDRCCYLPREVFFGRLGFAGAFFTVWASDFGRFLPATPGSFPVDVLPGAPYRGSAALCRGSASSSAVSPNHH